MQFAGVFFLSGKTRAFCLRTHSLFLSSPPSLPPSLLLGRSLSRQHPLPPASPIRKSERARARVRGAVHAAGARWCVYMPMQRDLLQCQKRPMRTTVTGTRTLTTILMSQSQKRPTTVSKETYYSVKRDLLQCQKRPTIVSKETYYSVKRDLCVLPLRAHTHAYFVLLVQIPHTYTHTHTHSLTHSQGTDTLCRWRCT